MTADGKEATSTPSTATAATDGVPSSQQQQAPAESMKQSRSNAHTAQPSQHNRFQPQHTNTTTAYKSSMILPPPPWVSQQCAHCCRFCCTQRLPHNASSAAHIQHHKGPSGLLRKASTCTKPTEAVVTSRPNSPPPSGPHQQLSTAAATPALPSHARGAVQCPGVCPQLHPPHALPPDQHHTAAAAAAAPCTPSWQQCAAQSGRIGSPQPEVEPRQGSSRSAALSSCSPQVAPASTLHHHCGLL